MKNKTLAEVDAEYFALIMSCHEAALDEVSNPDFVRVCPPPGGQGTGKPHLRMGHRNVQTWL